MIAKPLGLQASANLKPDRPFGYYYCYFELVENSAGASLAWPWDLGIDLDCGRETPRLHASGAFRPEIATLFRTLQYENREKTMFTRSARLRPS